MYDWNAANFVTDFADFYCEAIPYMAVEGYCTDFNEVYPGWVEDLDADIEDGDIEAILKKHALTKLMSNHKAEIDALMVAFNGNWEGCFPLDSDKYSKDERSLYQLLAAVAATVIDDISNKA